MHSTNVPQKRHSAININVLINGHSYNAPLKWHSSKSYNAPQVEHSSKSNNAPLMHFNDYKSQN